MREDRQHWHREIGKRITDELGSNWQKKAHPEMMSNELVTDSLSKFTLFETKGRFYITATSTASPNLHRVLKIDRAAHNTPTFESSPDIRESVTEDGTTYDAAQLDTLLRMVQDGNKGQGGLEKVLDFHGIVGFVRFTAGWYVILVTKRSVVGLLGGHYIFHCDETLLLTIASKPERTAQETKLLNTFQQVDLSKNFYYSYTYDLTNTLQTNLTMPNPLGHHEGVRRFNTRFMWNHHLLTPAFGLEGGDISGWVLPIIHGFVDQAKINVYSRTVYTTLIARRSRHFAGARYLKRGVNDQGHVANEVETEQIVSEPMITSFGFHARRETDEADDIPLYDPPTLSSPRGGYGNYTSFVQYRGSIPLIWTQDMTQMTPRPPIEISLVDPFYTAAAKHFDDLLGRYGAPLFVLNLIKCKEPVPRESKLLNEYGQCVQYLNQFLPEDKKMRYVAWDMARATKNKDQDVIGVLEDIAEESIQLTKFFHGGPARHDDQPGYRESPQLQNGITRTNCVDCLDRTNAAQFAIGKKAFGHQLYALGILKSPDLAFDSDVVDMLTEWMYHDHGDTLAWQYTGSALVNRMDTYRRTKTGQWTSHSRDLLENIRRFYANSMLDADKQAAINLFLGVDTLTPIGPQLPRHYQQWYNPNHLRNDEVDQAVLVPAQDVFREYYKPHILSQFQRLYAFTMNSTAKFANQPTTIHSPFQPRIAPAPVKRNLGVRRWMSYSGTPPITSKSNKVTTAVTPRQETAPAAPIDPQSVEGIVRDLLDLSSSEAKEAEYEWYTHYHADELLSSATLGEASDLLLYSKAAQLFAGEGVESLLASSAEAQAHSMAVWKEDASTVESDIQPPVRTARTYEPASANVQLYEHWLKT